MMVLLTKPRKQTLSTHVPQQPRKLTTAKTRPRITRATGTWSMTTTGRVWLSTKIGHSARDSRLTCSHIPHAINVHPPIYVTAGTQTLGVCTVSIGLTVASFRAKPVVKTSSQGIRSST